MKRIDALEAIYPAIAECVVVTIMGAVLSGPPEQFLLSGTCHGTGFIHGARHRCQPA